MPPPVSAREYRTHTAYLLAKHPLDQAMELAVGHGNYETVGDAEALIMREAGLAEGHSLIDIGCGSGRLAAALSRQLGPRISYLGIDVVPELLDYAKPRCDEAYRFLLTEGLNIPVSDNTADFVASFSLFTHLPATETAIYLREVHRALKPYGVAVFSFHDLVGEWRTFIRICWAERFGFSKRRRLRFRPRIGVSTYFLTNRTIRRWCADIGFEIGTIIPPSRIGQTVAILRKTA
jgi:SAM-dependent methyltransferase